MELISILIAIAGGIFGAAIGALPAFIFTGVTALIGWAIVLAGGDNTVLNEIAFGSFFGPHIAFAGGVAAAAFAGNKRKNIESGTSITIPLGTTNDVSVLLIGGVFGGLGFALNYLYGSVLGWTFDTIALTVATSGIIARLVFGSTGLIGKFTPSQTESKRSFIPDAKSFMFMLVFAAATALVTSHVADITQSGIVFAISAASLLFAQMGFGIPTTHHITAVAGTATLVTGNIWYGVLFGIISAIVLDLTGRTVNSHVDTHIDPPAVAIATCTCIIMVLFT
ncbi:MAG: hypothetical protein CVU84_05755 [Firmicutes bacterium HGW-Firmicutes-1]|jgi:hypothetical protein|nr:MAG: hypothetical protein CVU84_05755 [Firmicutes bacterium HGW-Firmicutes-1]